jgi:hypothetical protein
MKKAHQEKPVRKTALPVLKTGVRAGKEGSWWQSAKSWFKEQTKQIQ